MRPPVSVWLTRQAARLRTSSRSRVSLWPVSDESTSKLISELSARLAKGERVASALADARRALRGARKTDRWGRTYAPYDHPFYWAPFVVLGRD